MTNVFSNLNRRIFRGPLRRLRRDDKGIAAVEFALILPLMITLYLGCAEITQGVLASRKMAIVSRTLSDLVAQQPTAITAPCTAAGLCDATMNSIFNAATAIMSPFSTGFMTDGTTPSLTMVISSVEFTTYVNALPASVDATKVWIPTPTPGHLGNASPAPSGTNPGYEARVKWSKTASSPNSGTVRSCATSLTPSENTDNAAPSKLPKGLYASGALIIADVTYKYDPTFGGSVLAWVNAGGATYMSMSNTSYMRPRNWATGYITYPSQSGQGAGCTG